MAAKPLALLSLLALLGCQVDTPCDRVCERLHGCRLRVTFDVCRSDCEELAAEEMLDPERCATCASANECSEIRADCAQCAALLY